MRPWPSVLIPILTLALTAAACGGAKAPPECISDVDCAKGPLPGNDCQFTGCQDGQCLILPLEAGQDCVPSLPPGPCERAACDGRGACRLSAVPDGEACDDGDACTTADACLGGACSPGEEIVCPVPDDACHLQGSCQPDNGTCSAPLAVDGTPCDDGDPDTRADACALGICVGRRDVACPDPPACDAPPPDPGPETGFRHTTSSIAAALGAPYHRGRDLFLSADEDQWALGKFAYGLLADKDIHDEDVDIYLSRNCETWEYLGRATTTDDGEHTTVLGVEDTGGRVFFPIPEDRRLGVGRHRLHFVVLGDLSTAEQTVEVLPEGARAAVTDIDGTLTTSEYAQAWDTLLSISPEAHPGAADALWALARKGYHIFYLTARPEFLGSRTQTWLAERGFPPGISHTTLTHTGASGDAALAYKLAELDALRQRLGRAPDFGFGNKESDAEAFMQAGLDAAGCYYYELDGDPLGGTVHADYEALAAGFAGLSSLCWE